jgi:uncharacterized membrane protein
MFFNPLSRFFMAVMYVLLVFFFIVVQIDLVALVFVRIGIPPHYVMGALFLCLLGSAVNIPLKRIPQEAMTEGGTVRFFGFRYVIPPSPRRETVLAVNVGGAVVPALISAYLLVKTGVFLPALLATAATTFITHRAARPVRGVGIALPFFLAPFAAALLALAVDAVHAPVVAYISGTLGTLIGADILNIKKIGRLGAPVASIGGAGTFDGIFLTGILAVALSALFA